MKIFKNKDCLYYFTLFFLIVLLFVDFTPKLSVKIFPSVKKNKFNEFNRYLLTTNQLNPQVFWQFREFFCPGYFKVEKSGMQKNNPLLLNFLTNKKEEFLIFAKYNCSYLNSLEILTTKNQLLDIINKEKIIKNYRILRLTDEFIYFKNKDKNRYYLFFLVDKDKLQNTVGFFDYREKDKKIVEKNLNWISFTVYQL